MSLYLLITESYIDATHSPYSEIVLDPIYLILFVFENIGFPHIIRGNTMTKQIHQYKLIRQTQQSYQLS